MGIYEQVKNLNFKTILEAGGNVGQDTKKLCEMFPDAAVHTCEPVEVLFDGLMLLKPQYPNLSLYRIALSDHDGTTEFWLDLNSHGTMGASSILKSHDDYHAYLDKEELTTVTCMRLDSFIYNIGLDKIDFCWLDLEMSEYMVLNASKDILKNIGYIYLEISYSQFRIGQPTPQEIDDLLTSNGFDQIFIEPQGSPDFDWQANVLYKNAHYK